MSRRGHGLLRRAAVASLQSLACWQAGAFAFLVTLAFIAPLTASAQTPETPPVRLFISNESEFSVQPSSEAVDNGSIFTIAQQFTTGPLDIIPRKLTLWFDSRTASDVDDSSLSVAIWLNGTSGPQSSSGTPPGKHLTFTNPSSLGQGEREFTYSGTSDLDKNTTYHIVVQYNQPRDTKSLYVQTASRSTTTEISEGWTLGPKWEGQDGSFMEITDNNFRHRRLRLKLEGIQKDADATGEPTISGTVQVGQTVTVETDAISDLNGTTGATFDLQWHRFEADSNQNIMIPSATGATYDVQSADLGKRLGVKVSFSDDDGYEEELLPTPITAAVVSSDVPRISVEPNESSVVGGSGTDGVDAVFTLTRTGDLAAQLTVGVSVSGDGAVASELTSITEATFAAASATVEVPVQTIPVADGDSEKTVTLTVQAGDGYVARTPPSATVTVTASQGTRATGEPAIEGTVRVGEMLEAKIGTIVDPDDQPTESVLTCVWQRQDVFDDDSSWNDISGANSCAYTVAEADLEKRLRVVVSFDDNMFRQSETLTSQATVSVVAANNPAGGTPVITGTAQVGEMLRAGRGDISDPDGDIPFDEVGYSYKWDRMNPNGSVDAEDVGGDSVTYILVDADIGKKLRVTLRFTDHTGDPEMRTSELYPSGTDTVEAAPEPDVSVSHSGSVIGGEDAIFTLSRTGDTANPLTVNIQITGNGALTTPPLPQTAMFEAGMATVDVTVPTVTIAPGAGIRDVTFQVQRGSGYNVPNPSVSGIASLTVLEPSNNGATGEPLLTGTPVVGQTLTAAPGTIRDEDGLTSPTYSYEWSRVRLGETSSNQFLTTQEPTYVLTAADLGYWIDVLLMFQDDVGFREERSSNLIGPVVAASASQTGTPATGAPRILGTPQVGRVVTATAGDVDDVDGLPQTTDGYSYNWISAADSTGTDTRLIGDGTSATYTVSSFLERRHLQVIVSFTDGDGNLEFRSSDWTVAVVAAEAGQPSNSPASGEPMYPSGNPQVGQALTATTDDIGDTDGLPQAASDYSFQWSSADDASGSNAAQIPGATSATYTPTAADVGKHLRVTVLFADGRGTVESRSSDWSDAVAPETGVQQPATGTPLITGTRETGQTLTATNGDIDDADGLPTKPGDFSYQWSRADDSSGTNAAPLMGENSSTYTLVAADEGKYLQVTVSFTDLRGNQESRDSEWTSATTQGPPEISIAAHASSAVEPAPGVAAIIANTLEFTVTLSRPLSAQTTVTYSLGGTATEGVDYDEHTTKILEFSANDTEGQITISAIGDIVSEPDETVIVTLVSVSEGEIDSGSNSATGTITERQDQIQVSATRPAYDYSEDDSETTVSFDIELMPAPTSAGTVEWRVVIRDSAGRIVRQTEKNTANIGGSASSRRVTTTLDAEPPAGGSIEILLQPFAEQGRSAVSAVAPSNDLMDGDEETVSVASAEWVVAGLIAVTDSATSNDRAITSALTAFGRSTATNLVETIWSRAEAHRHGSIASFASLGGRSIDTSAFASGAGARQVAQETARLIGIEAVNPAVAPTADAAGAPLVEGNLEDFRSWAGLADGRGIARKSSFALALDEGGGSSIVYWGAGSLSNFSSELDDAGDSTLATEGSTTTISLGLDYRQSESTLLGFAVSSNSGSAEYEFDNSSEGSGDLSSSLNSFTPWVRWKSSAGMELWGAFGIGSGAADGMRDGEKVEMDLSAQILAVGAWNLITTFGNSNIAAKADYFSATVSSDGAGDEVDGTDAGSSRIRVAAEMSSGQSPSSGSATAYALEMGARLDSGEAESGFGVDVAAEFDYGGPRSSVSITGRGGLTLFHGQEGFSETGFSLGITYDPGADARGLQLSLSPAWNPPRSNSADLVWNAASSETFSPSTSKGAEIEARLGYGIAAMENHALATLYGGVRSAEDENWLRLGGELVGPGRKFGGLILDLYGEAGERRDGPERALRLEGRLIF